MQLKQASIHWDKKYSAHIENWLERTRLPDLRKFPTSSGPFVLLDGKPVVPVSSYKKRKVFKTN